MSYDVYWVKNRAEKIADFEHPSQEGFSCISLNKKFIFIENILLEDK